MVGEFAPAAIAQSGLTAWEVGNVIEGCKGTAYISPNNATDLYIHSLTYDC